MSFEFRTIEPHERDAVLDLLAGWLNDRAFFARYFEHDPAFRDDLCFVAVDDGRIVSTLQVFGKLVRADGALLRVGGVGNVYTEPAYRDRRLAGALLERAIAAMDRQGFDASLLFAIKLDFYAHYGWRSSLRHLTFIEPGGGATTPVESFDAGRDLDAVAAVYAAYSAAVAGSTERDAVYWRGQLRYAGNPDERFVVARRDGSIVAYARATVLYDFNTVIEHACVPGSEDALAGLIAHLHAGADKGTLAQVVPAPALEAALAARGLRLRAVEDRSWMWRPLDRERLAATLRLPLAAVQREGFFAELFPATASRYWLSDRF